MAITTKNKYPADKSGTKYSDFKNTKRVPAGKARAEREGRQPGTETNQAASKPAEVNR